MNLKEKVTGCSFPVSPALEYQGCFKEGKPLSVPKLLENFKGTFKPIQAGKITQACAKLAQAKGWDHFAIGGKEGLSCYSGPNAAQTYDDAGKGKTNCGNQTFKLGKKGDIAVYKIIECEY